MVRRTSLLLLIVCGSSLIAIASDNSGQLTHQQVVRGARAALGVYNNYLANNAGSQIHQQQQPAATNVLGKGAYILEQNETMPDELMREVLQNAPRDVQDLIKNFEQIADVNADARQVKEIKDDINFVWLFAGAPGCGKTLLAKAIALKRKKPYQIISSGSFTTEFYSSGKQNLLRFFDPLLNSNQEITIIFDEINALTDAHGQHNNSGDTGMIEHFWSLLDKCNKEKNIFIIGTTNKLENIPTPLFNRSDIYTLQKPGISAVKRVMELYLKENNSLSEWRLWWYAFKFSGLSFRSIERIIKKARSFARAESSDGQVNKLTANHIDRALAHCNEADRAATPSIAYRIAKECSSQWPILLGIATNLGWNMYVHNKNMSVQAAQFEQHQTIAKQANEQQLHVVQEAQQKNIELARKTADKQLEMTKEHNDSMWYIGCFTAGIAAICNIANTGGGLYTNWHFQAESLKLAQELAKKTGESATKILIPNS